MKKAFNRITAITLAALSVLSYSSCAGASVEQTDSVDTTSQSEPVEEKFLSHLEGRSLNGRTFTVLTAAEQWIGAYDAEQNGDIIADAVYKRNSMIMEQFDVELEYHVMNGYGAGKEAVRAALVGSVLGGTLDYDVLVGDGYYHCSHMLEGLLQPLNTLGIIDFSKEWWYQDTNEAHRINGNIYLASGHWSYNNYGQICTPFINRTIETDYKLENIYDVIESGRWTYEKMREMSRTVTKDLDGNNVMDENDRFGFVFCAVGAISPFTTAMGYKYFDADSDKQFQLNGFTEKLDTINGYIYNAFNDETYALNEKFERAITRFTSGKSLFFLYRLDTLARNELREMDNYGIIPQPKFDESQEDYIIGGGCDISAIPAAVKNAEESAVIIEAMNAYGHRDVLPAYYNYALQSKYTRDEESAKMLEIICNNIYTDPAITYESMTGSLYYAIGSTESLAAFYAESSEAIQTAIDSSIKKMN